MLYRIRYDSDEGSGEAEVAIEANTPTEAIVKFRHMHSGSGGCKGGCANVTSVSPDPLCDQIRWGDGV
ncbi:MAG: hypothetical protein KAX78_09710 [Phycisphaerae bacterium]|nr:hypothetical protein [Phycisphaerae bacterium]